MCRGYKYLCACVCVCVCACVCACMCICIIYEILNVSDFYFVRACNLKNKFIGSLSESAFVICS